jgi:putative peptidoglycan lipid II flippase
MKASPEGVKTSEEHRVTRAAGIIGLATLISRILGFVRDVVVAAIFGATLVADTFYVAYRIPSMLRELFAEGSMSAGFIPVFTEYLKKRSREESRRLAQSAFTMVLLGLTLVSLLGIFLAPWLVQAIAPGFRNDPHKLELSTYLTQLMFPYLLFIGLAALAMGILNSMRSFAAPAISPAIFNLGVIFAVLIVAPLLTEPIAGVAIGVLIGGVAQWLIQLPGLYHHSMGLRLRWEPTHEGLKRIGLLLLPILLGLSVSQINIFFNTLFASFLPDGSVTYLYYGMRLIHFPLGIFGIALATAILPSLSAQAVRNEQGELRETVSFGLRLVFFMTFPALVGLIMLRIPIVHLLFQHGEFTYQATLGTAAAVFGYAVGLWAFGGVRIVVSAFYALQDTKTPVRVAMLAVGANILLSLMLMPYLKHAGLALAASLASILNLSLLLWQLQKRFRLVDWRRILTSNVRVITASAVMGLLCWWVAKQGIWIMEGHWIHKSFLLAGGILGSVGVYVVVHLIMKSEETFFLWKTVKDKIDQSR